MKENQSIKLNPKYEIALQSVKTIETQYRPFVECNDGSYLRAHNWSNEAIAALLIGVHLRLARIEEKLKQGNAH